MSLLRRTAAAATLLAVFGGLGACDGFKKVPDACSVTISPREVTVPVNGTTVVVGAAFDCDGNSIAKKTVKFSSSNPLVASVTAAGQIIGVAVGTATVSASANGKTADAIVTVGPEKVQTVAVSPATATFRRTQLQQMTAVAKNVQGTVISGITFQWASSNSSVASIDNTGKLSALAPGTVNITATADGQTGTALITITEIPIGSCSLAPGNQKVTVSNQVQPTLTLKDTASNPLSSTGRAINWTSDNNLVASVQPTTGVVNALKKGTAIITASDAQNAATFCTTTVEVVDARIFKVNITPVNALLRVGLQRQFTVALLDSNNTPISPVGRTVTWKNVTPNVATVGPTGIVTGNVVSNSGKVAVDAEGTVDTASFRVDKIPVQSVTVTPPQRTVVEGQTAQFTTTVIDSVGNTVTDRTIDWLSSNNTVGTVTGGLVTTLASGTITITAINTESNKSGTATLIITPVPVDTITVTQTTFSLKVNTTAGISINLLSAAGAQIRNRNVVVTSDQPNITVGTANQTSTIVNVTGVAQGTATLTIQATNSNGQNEGKATKVIINVTP